MTCCVCHEGGDDLIAIGIIFHQNLRELEVCLRSIQDSTEEDSRIFLVDTSDQGCAADTAIEYSVTWVDGSRNAGYSWAANLFVDRCGPECDVVIISNSDVVFRPGSISTLVARSREQRAICYPLQLDDGGVAAEHSIHPVLTRMVLYGYLLLHAQRFARRTCNAVVRSSAAMGAPVEVPDGCYGSGAVIVVPVSEYRRIGGMDEDFHLFAEDMLLTVQAQALRVPVFLCGDAPVVHNGGVRTREVSGYTLIEGIASGIIAARKLRICTEGEVKAVYLLWALSRTLLTRRDSSAHAAYREGLAYIWSNMFRVFSEPRGRDGLRIQAWR